MSSFLLLSTTGGGEGDEAVGEVGQVVVEVAAAGDDLAEQVGVLADLLFAQPPGPVR